MSTKNAMWGFGKVRLLLYPNELQDRSELSYSREGLRLNINEAALAVIEFWLSRHVLSASSCSSVQACRTILGRRMLGAIGFSHCSLVFETRLYVVSTIHFCFLHF